MSESWSLTESDPAVFTGLLHGVGVKGLEVEELYGLDESLLQDLHPVYALVFLFKWVGSKDGASRDGTFEQPGGDLYFAQQVITNACASFAILNATLNIPVDLGEELTNLKAFSEGLDSETRGWIISNSEKIREVHNSFAKQDSYQLDESRQQDESEDAYHFITYLPIGNKLYELDGLTASPISHGVLEDPTNWLTLAKQVIERRIATYAEGQVHFSLMAITGRSAHLTAKLATLQAEFSTNPSPALSAELADLTNRLALIHEQHKEWEFENAVRQHNHIGLIHSLLLTMAKEGKLQPAIEAAQGVMKQRIADKKAKGEPIVED